MASGDSETDVEDFSLQSGKGLELNEGSEYPDLIDTSEVLYESLSKSAKQKVAQASKMLESAAAARRRDDPKKVAASTSRFVVTLLHTYTNLGKGKKADEIKKEDALIGMIAGLRWVYKLHGHRGPWTLTKMPNGTVQALGNPLISNGDIITLRLAHRRILSELGATTRHAPPLPTQYIVEHAKAFWLEEQGFDRRDVTLHAVLLIAINCGFRYAEVKQLKLEQMSLTRDDVTLMINGRTKNSLLCKDYAVDPWPGSHFIYIILMDPFVALSAWLEVRGDTEGFVFCDIDGTGQNQRLKHADAWPTKKFHAFLRQRLGAVGMAPALAAFFTGHSLKRTCVQLLRVLGVRDIDIMERVKMEGERAYLRYTEAFNMSIAKEAPAFNSLECTEKHVEAMKEDRDLKFDDGLYSFMDNCLQSA